MKVGDKITTFAPNGALVTGDVVHVEPLKTRSGWRVQILPESLGEWMNYLLRPEDEGSTWIYGDDQKGKNALLTAHAIGDTTEVSPKTGRWPSRNEASTRSKKRPV